MNDSMLWKIRDKLDQDDGEPGIMCYLDFILEKK